MDYRGSPNLINTRILVCPPCYDQPQPQLSPVILSPDPPPIYNARPEPYAIDETSWLSTQIDEIIDTQDGDDIIVNQPNPSNSANTAPLAATVDGNGQAVTTLYLDLFNGNPTAGGYSVLSAITGSSTRTNIGASLATTNEVATNFETIVVSTGSASITNVNWVAFYAASSGGSPLMWAPVSVGLTGGVAIGTAVQFNATDLVITEAGGGEDMVSELGLPMQSQLTGQYMITE